MVAVSTVRQFKGSARNNLQIEEQRDFTGGLNLADDPYKLAPNETFDLQDVDIDRRGGFGVRRGVRPFINRETARIVTATGASRTGNVVTAVGLSPLNGDANGGLVAGQQYTVNFQDDGYDGTFTIVSAVAGASTATWAQTAANDPAAGPGTMIESNQMPDSGYTYVDTSAVRHILVARNGQVRRYNGAEWVDVIRVFGGSGRTEFEEFRNVLYMVQGQSVPYTWSGSGLATQLTTAAGNYNDSLEAPNAGNFPQCQTMAVHKEVMWAGGVVEAGSVVHNSRVRWSHPGAAQDWRTNDFIDLDPDDENGNIRALIPFGDRLLVFKDKAIYAIHGDPPAGFTVQNLTKELGAPSHWAVKATEQIVFFWDKDKGAWSYDGKSFKWIFEPLYRLIDDGIINTQFSFQSILEVHRDRVWVSVPSAVNSIYGGNFLSLVYQPEGDKGSWTLHTKTAFGWWVHAGSDGGDLHLLGALNQGAGANYVYEFDTEAFFEDRQATGPLAANLVASTTNSMAATTPDSALHDITNDLDVQIDVIRDDWLNTSDASEWLVSKYQAVAGGRSWGFRLADGGFLSIIWSTDGAAAQPTMVSNAAIPASYGSGELFVRVTLDVDDGAGNRVATFYYRRTEEADWTMLGTPVVVAGTTSIFNSSAAIVIGGALDAGGAVTEVLVNTDCLTGYVVEMTAKNGIGGTEFANPKFWNQPALSPTFTDTAGLIWTLVNNAKIMFHLENRRIEAHYTTRWFDAKNSAQKKRWKRPVVVLRAGADQKTLVKVLRDYDPTRVFKQFELFTFADAETGVWDDPATEWDDEQWAAEDVLGGEKSVALRGAPLSGGIARSLRFENTTQGQDWRIHGLIMKWIPRRIRN